MEKPIPPLSKKLPLKQKVEAILFAVGARISLAHITRLARSREDAVKETLQQLKGEYEQKDSSLILVEDGEMWKLAVRDHYLPVVKKIVTETELSKTVLETLAVIAFKYPIRQSDLIKIRTNKAYDHLKDLEGQGFISRKKHGRTNLIKLTEKFFQYFDLAEDKLKEHLADFESIAQAIVKRETELTERKRQQADELSQMSSQEDRIKKEIEGLDGKQTGQMGAEAGKQEGEGGQEAEKPLITPEKLGSLEVFEEKTEEKAKENEKVEVYEAKEDSSQESSSVGPSPAPKPHDESIENEQSPEDPEPKTSPLPGIEATPEMQTEIDKKVADMLTPKQPEESDEPKGYDPSDEKGDDELEGALDAIRKRKQRGKEK